MRRRKGEGERTRMVRGAGTKDVPARGSSQERRDATTLTELVGGKRGGRREEKPGGNRHTSQPAQPGERGRWRERHKVI